MKTESHSVDEVLAKNATSFVIPPFQRAYAWGKQEIERYFSDIVRIIKSELDPLQHDKLEHFFGTVVIKEEKSGFANRSVVVDGQQRLTTTLLFLIALRDSESDSSRKRFITQNYLINNTSTFQDKIKLKQVTKDWEAYKALVNNTEPQKGVIDSGYQLLLKLIAQNNKANPQIKFDHYIIAIQRINVAVIFLDERPFKGEDPQIIFETLNSLGKPLTLSDLVRNFVLLNMDSIRQTNIYDKIWHPEIEEILNESASNFFRDYLQYKTASSVKVVSDNNTKEVYQLFKEFVENNFKDHNDFIDDITQYVVPYKWILTEVNTDRISNNSVVDEEIKELLRNIFHDIKSEAFKPFVLGLLFYYRTGSRGVRLSGDILISILKTIWVYLIRRRILGLAQGENKNIVLLSNRIELLATGSIKMVELLSNMFYRLRLPNDSEMRNGLIQMNFYDELKKYSKFILGKIEEHRTKVAVNFRNPKITIEHVMPQTLNKDWQEELGPDYIRIHKLYLNNIGNLILTEFNSEIGNKPFREKKMKLSTSSLNFRLDVINRPYWDEDSIKDHMINMIRWFLETFPLPINYRENANWNSKEIESTSFSPLDGESGDVAEGNKPVELRINDEIFKVKTWQDVFIRFLKYLKENKDYDFDFILDNQLELFRREDTLIRWRELRPMIEDNIDKTNRFKTFEGKVWNSVRELNDNVLFIHVNISATGCMSRIANIMNKFNMPEDSVVIRIR